MTCSSVLGSTSNSTAPSEMQSGIPNDHLGNAQGQSQQQNNTRVPWPQISPDRETDSSLHTLLSILSEEKHLSEESAQDLHRFGMVRAMFYGELALVGLTLLG